jgi:hypothetical protein
MSFISFAYDSYDRTTDQYIYTLVDSEFGSVKGGVEGGIFGGVGVGEFGLEFGVAVGVAVGVAREYSKRNLPVGRNLALTVLWMYKTYPHYSIKQRIEWQDQYCPKHVENWQQYAAERDDALEKLLALT